MSLPLSIDSFVLAEGSDDFIEWNIILTFPAGFTLATFQVLTINDTLFELDEDFSAVLTNPDVGLKIGAANSALIRILDDDSKFTVM